MTTIRELASKQGLKLGDHKPGALNHLLDVPGVGVAHRTFRDPDRSICTGFTVIQPTPKLGQRCAAGVFSLNGAGELTNSHAVREWGFLDTPIVLTDTPSVGRAYDAVSEWMMRKNPAIGGDESVVIPVVGECDDSVLQDPRVRAWQSQEVFDALEEAVRCAQVARVGAQALTAAPQAIGASALAQGDVGAGTGMIAFELKAGIGSSSRQVTVAGKPYTIGVLLQTNFGLRDQLTVLGKNIGPKIKKPLPQKHVEGSCIGILATDAPLSPLGLERLARRMSLGLARTGSHAHHGSGEIFLALSTAREPRHELSWDRDQWNPLLQAAVEASEEAVYQSLVCANRVQNKRATVEALSVGEVSAAFLK